jgi:hypothetical protein
MQKKALLIGVILILINLSSCTISLPKLATDYPVGPSVGQSTCTCYFGFICQDADISLKSAAANGKIVKISTVDVVTNMSILGIFTQYTTIVTGYTKEQLVAEEIQKLETSSQVNTQEGNREHKEVAINQKPELLSTQKSDVSQIKTQETPLTNDKTDVIVEKRVEDKKLIDQEPVSLKNEQESNKRISAAERIRIAEEQIRLAEEQQAKKQELNSKNSSNTSFQQNKPKNIPKQDIVGDYLSELPQIRLKGTSLSDLSSKLKAMSEIQMKNGDLYPIDVVIDLKRFTFACNFIKRSSSFIKLGLYFGPKNIGCESCDNVIIRNPGSEIIYDEISGNLIVQVIAIKGN